MVTPTTSRAADMGAKRRFQEGWARKSSSSSPSSPCPGDGEASAREAVDAADGEAVDAADVRAPIPPVMIPWHQRQRVAPARTRSWQKGQARNPSASSSGTGSAKKWRWHWGQSNTIPEREGDISWTFWQRGQRVRMADGQWSWGSFPGFDGLP